ncbi:hypothetical protein ANO14919_011750 [Xylariales sp. No.14919]|nr:hypothetical protein ANO14919_011750 [Xylariales sp. No.14919]
MEPVEDHQYGGVDPLASPSDSCGSNATPDTEYSPPDSPFPKQPSLKNSRSVARKKLASLTVDEKVCVTGGPASQAKQAIGLPSYCCRLLENEVHT